MTQEIILPDCPAPRHNTVRAARGHGRAGGVRLPRCICPFAQKALKEDNQRRREYRWAARRGMVVTGSQQAQEAQRLIEQRDGIFDRFAAAPAISAVPDLTTGNCAHPVGAAIMETYLDRGKSRGALEAARKVCMNCPVDTLCAGWVKTAERPAGSWQGIYAGLAPAARRAVATRLAASGSS